MAVFSHGLMARGRLAIPVLIAVIAALLPVAAQAAPNAYNSFNEFATGPFLPRPFDIVTGPDGNIWYTAANSDSIVKASPVDGSVIQQWQVNNGVAGCDTTGIAVGPDGNIYVACFGEDLIVRVTVSGGVVTYFPLPASSANNTNDCACPEFLTAGPDGFLWFAEAGSGYIAKLRVSTGSLYEYPLPGGSSSDPRGIAVGSDGNIWFAETDLDLIGRMTPTGSVTEYHVPTAGALPFGMTSGPDGNLYFAEIVGNKIGRVDTSGNVTEFTVPTANAGIRMVTVGPDGNIWFTERDSGKIGSLSPAGGFQELTPPTANSQPFGVATGPDGNLWFTEAGANQIARVGVRHNILYLDKTAIGFGNAVPGVATAAQRVTLNNFSSSETLPAFTPYLSGVSGTLGTFTIAAETCSAGPIPTGGSCYVDITFTGTAPGNSLATLTFPAQFNTGLTDPTMQLLTVGLTATVPANVCASTSITTDVPSPQNVGAQVTLQAAALGCRNANPLFRFYLRDTDAVWHIVRDFSANASFVWDTSTYPAGTYLTGVWAKDAQSTNTYDAYAFGTFTLQVPNCSSTNLSSDVDSPRAAGTTVTFTATSIGCPNPLYQWWVRDAAGNWNIAVPFAAGNTFAWNTSNLTEGTYQIGVWAKQQFSGNSYDAFAFVTYTLTVSHCSSVGLDTAPTSPQATGATVTLTADALGCPGAQYRFYVRDVAGTWHIVQDFSTTKTYAWTTTSPVSTSNPGTYLLGVWARQPGSANSYDAFFFLTFSLTSGTTCTVNISPDLASPKPLGTSVTWTATASNCPGTPLKYQFWVNPPGGTWTIAQPFSTTNTFTWTGATAGTYQIGVWVKQATSTASYDNFAFTTYTLTPTSAPQVCSSVGVTPSVTSPRAVGTPITFTAAANDCASPQYQWWIRDTAANWAIARSYANSSATLDWNTTGLVPGTYLVGVWARQTGSSASYEAYSFITFTLTGAPAQKCSSTNVSPDLASPQPPGTVVTFTATAAGCDTPDFRFFIAPPGGAFAQAQAWGATNTLAWNTSGLPPGPYQIGVWARQHGSTATYEAFAFITYQLQATGTACSTLSLFPSNTTSANDITSQSPQPSGVTLTWHASAGGCSGTEYQFYIQLLGSPAPFILAQPFSSTATTLINTSGLPAGIYHVLVLARRVGFTGTFEVYAVSSYELV
jgi:streptogramin lyase